MKYGIYISICTYIYISDVHETGPGDDVVPLWYLHQPPQPPLVGGSHPLVRPVFSRPKALI